MTTKDKALALQNEAFQVLVAKYGKDRVRLEPGKFSSSVVKMIVTIAMTDDVEAQRENLRQEFTTYIAGTALVPSDFDLPLTVNGMPGKLVAIRWKAPKKPYLIRVEDGREFICTEDLFLNARARNAMKKPA